MAASSVLLGEVAGDKSAPALWGVKVANVEVKQVDLPESMLRAMAKQAEMEREKRSKIIHAEGEYSAAQRLVDAASLLALSPCQWTSFRGSPKPLKSEAIAPVPASPRRPAERIIDDRDGFRLRLSIVWETTTEEEHASTVLCASTG
jgi:hypothetical protein